MAARTLGSDAWRVRIEDVVTSLVNLRRLQAGLPALRTEERLRVSARLHSADMATRDFFDHVCPDGSTPSQRMRAAGYDEPGAENIARGQHGAHQVVTGWMNSPGHRKNILHPALRTIGVGVVLGDGGPWWTQHFGY